jgi:hypothetical protein
MSNMSGKVGRSGRGGGRVGVSTILRAFAWTLLVLSIPAALYLLWLNCFLFSTWLGGPCR